MGTFKLRPTSLVSSTWVTGTNVCALPQLAAFQKHVPGCNIQVHANFTPAPGVLARLGFDTVNSIFLDGASVATPFASLPLGFFVAAGTVQANIGGLITLNVGPGPGFLTPSYFVQFDQQTEALANNAGPFYPGPVNNILTLIGNGMGFRGVVPASAGELTLNNQGTSPDGFSVSGTYGIQSNSWKIPTPPAGGYAPGDRVILNSITGLNPAGITSLSLLNVATGITTPITDFVVISPCSILFYMPVIVSLVLGGSVLLYGNAINQIGAFTVVSNSLLAPASVTPSYNFPVTSGITAGQQVTIYGPGMDHITSINIQYIDTNGNVHTNTVYSQDFLVQLPCLITFIFPQFGNLYPPGGTMYVYLNSPDFITGISGTQFNGSVLAGTVTAVYADSSGLYQLVQGKTTDTVYNTARDGTTTEVNIPDPTVDTAYLP